MKFICDKCNQEHDSRNGRELTLYYRDLSLIEILELCSVCAEEIKSKAGVKS